MLRAAWLSLRSTLPCLQKEKKNKTTWGSLSFQVSLKVFPVSLAMEAGVCSICACLEQNVPRHLAEVRRTSLVPWYCLSGWPGAGTLRTMLPHCRTKLRNIWSLCPCFVGVPTTAMVSNLWPGRPPTQKNPLLLTKARAQRVSGILYIV